MANFAVAADQAIIDRGNKIIDQMQRPGEKKRRNTCAAVCRGRSTTG